MNEPTVEVAVEIMKGLRKKYEEHHHAIFTDEALEASVEYSVRYLPDRFLPDKAIDLIDEAVRERDWQYESSARDESLGNLYS